MKKLLYCASNISHIENFHLPYLKALTERGFSVFTCAEQSFLFDNTKGCFALPFEKRFLSGKNIKAIFLARRLLKEQNFDILVLNTALAAAVFRMALLTLPRNSRPRVIYICHGFLFGENDGLSALKFLIPEKLLAKMTDTLAVMNDEDERLAKRHRLCGDIRRINGMGLPDGKYRIPAENERELARKSLGLDKKDYAFVCVGEFSHRKNQQAVINAFAKAYSDMPDAVLLFAGSGELLLECETLAEKLDIDNSIRFLGYRADILSLLFAADAAVSASISEGIPFAVTEALCCGLPAVLSDIKGHRDLVSCGGVTLFDNEYSFCRALKALYDSRERCHRDMSCWLLPDVMSQILSLYDCENEENE